MRAVGTLQADPAYKDKIETEIIGMGTERGEFSIKVYDWGAEGHGLVVLSPDGEVLAVLKGHSWGGLEEKTALDKLKETIDPLLQG